MHNPSQQTRHLRTRVCFDISDENGKALHVLTHAVIRKSNQIDVKYSLLMDILKSLSREFVAISAQRMLVLQCFKESVPKTLILRKGSLGANLGPAKYNEGVFCDQSQNFPREFAVNIEK